VTRSFQLKQKHVHATKLIHLKTWGQWNRVDFHRRPRRDLKHVSYKLTRHARANS